jgi:hypothetical protein
VPVVAYAVALLKTKFNISNLVKVLAGSVVAGLHRAKARAFRGKAPTQSSDKTPMSIFNSERNELARALL